MTQPPVQQLSFLGPLLVGTDHYKPGTPPQDLPFWRCSDPVFHHSLALIQGAQILPLAHLSCFQRIDFKTWPLTCCLVYPTPWHPWSGGCEMMRWWCYSLHRSVVLMLWLISVFFYIFTFFCLHLNFFFFGHPVEMLFLKYFTFWKTAHWCPVRPVVSHLSERSAIGWQEEKGTSADSLHGIATRSLFLREPL